MRVLTIQVTQEHILTMANQTTELCPVALALVDVGRGGCKR